MNGERMKRRRKLLGISGEMIAKELGFNRVTVARWESGANEPDDNTKIALAKMLQTTVSYLVGETNNPERPNSGKRGQNSVINDKGSIVCEWGDRNRITLPDNLQARDLLYKFFNKLLEYDFIALDDMPTGLFKIIPVKVPAGVTGKQLSDAVSHAINSVYPDVHIKVNFVRAANQSDLETTDSPETTSSSEKPNNSDSPEKPNSSDKPLNNPVPMVSAYNGENSSYTGNTLNVNTGAQNE